MAGMMLALAIVSLSLASASKCSAGSCAEQGDETSFVQLKKAMKNGYERSWEAMSLATSDDLQRIYALQLFHANKTAKMEMYERIGLDTQASTPDGFLGGKSMAGSKKCFISKKSAFTDPDHGLKHGCQNRMDLSNIEDQNVRSEKCWNCFQALEKLKKEGFFSKKVWDTRHHMPATCHECDGEWKGMCLPPVPEGKKLEDIIKETFQSQQAFMTKVGNALKRHDISLYLDFVDPDAEALVDSKKCGGRDKAFNIPACYQDMLALLRQRAGLADVFVHWLGASGGFCLAEQVGKNDAVEEYEFLEAPVHYLQNEYKSSNGHKTKFKDPACYSRKFDDGFTDEPFLVEVCKACGGKSCETICNDDILEGPIPVIAAVQEKSDTSVALEVVPEKEPVDDDGPKNTLKAEWNQFTADMDEAVATEKDEYETEKANDCDKGGNLGKCSCINRDDTETECDVSDRCRDNKGAATSFYWDFSDMCKQAGCGSQPSRSSKSCCVCHWEEHK